MPGKAGVKAEVNQSAVSAAGDVGKSGLLGISGLSQGGLEYFVEMAVIVQR
jgi:hypothetical protein